MVLSDWEPKYTVNHPVIDDHHDILFKLVDRLGEAAIEKKENNITEEALESLQHYTRRYFPAEELFMRQVKFPNLDRHKEAHVNLTSKVHEFQRRYKDGDRAITAEILQFLMVEWLIKHVIGMDELCAPYFKKFSP